MRAGIVDNHKAHKRMRYITTFERHGIAKGLAKGRKEGLKEGIDSYKTALNNILQSRFERFMVKLTSSLENIDNLEILQNLIIKAALTESLDELSEYLATFARETTNKPDVKKVSEPATAYKPSKKEKKATARSKSPASAKPKNLKPA